ncbi:MAG: 30S ribosomal protein S16 [Acidobacteria bacterium]|nr:30S ribosomal protein S16 [Acidobacteriota bacterium]
MLTIRLRRQGAKKSPFYRLVVIDSRSARDGRALEVVGHYDPTVQPEALTVKIDRIEHWVALGAQMSDTVRTLIARNPAAAAAAGGEEAAESAAAPAAS